jgi:hypothetical protein
MAASVRKNPWRIPRACQAEHYPANEHVATVVCGGGRRFHRATTRRRMMPSSAPARGRRLREVDGRDVRLGILRPCSRALTRCAARVVQEKRMMDVAPAARSSRTSCFVASCAPLDPTGSRSTGLARPKVLTQCDDSLEWRSPAPRRGAAVLGAGNRQCRGWPLRTSRSRAQTWCAATGQLTLMSGSRGVRASAVASQHRLGRLVS